LGFLFPIWWEKPTKCSKPPTRQPWFPVLRFVSFAPLGFQAAKWHGVRSRQSDRRNAQGMTVLEFWSSPPIKSRNVLLHQQCLFGITCFVLFYRWPRSWCRSHLSVTQAINHPNAMWKIGQKSIPWQCLQTHTSENHLV
jgi:hypothetical protein